MPVAEAEEVVLFDVEEDTKDVVIDRGDPVRERDVGVERVGSGIRLEGVVVLCARALMGDDNKAIRDNNEDGRENMRTLYLEDICERSYCMFVL